MKQVNQDNSYQELLWLIQPVSPALNHFAVVGRLGFNRVLGFVDPNCLDHPNRLVLAVEPNPGAAEDSIKRTLASSKWVAGFRLETWGNDEIARVRPLSGEEVEKATASIGQAGEITFGGIRFEHSSKLPDWP